MPGPCPSLQLKPNSVLPAGMAWCISDGYVRQVTWNEDTELITLMLWGPGDLILGSQATFECRNETTTISHVSLEGHTPTDLERHEALKRQISRSMEIMRISRIRKADDRLLTMLRWLAAQFGRVNSLGHSLSLEDMNLTHQVIAELTGLTRVTVTKSLNKFKSLAQAIPMAHGDLLLPHRADTDGFRPCRSVTENSRHRQGLPPGSSPHDRGAAGYTPSNS